MQSLTPFHTFHLPVQAKKIVEYRSTAELLREWQMANLAGEPVLLLGQGSNVLFLDDFQGTVLINRLMGIEKREDGEFYYLHVAGGENWHNLVQWSVENQMAGLENLALIPGVAGSAPIQNIGAYGVEFERVCNYVDVLNLKTGEQFRLNKDECEFGYRDSIFKHQYREHYAVTAVGLKLAKAWQPVLSYGSLADVDPKTVTAKQIFDEICEIRRAKLPNPDELGNAGSFFKNPVVSLDLFAQIRAKYPTIPHYSQPNGDVKLPAGWLIDQCQLKGFKLGGAAVHIKQALVLVNQGNATGADVVRLAKAVRRLVREKFGVEIHPEVRFMGATGEIDSEEITR